MGVALRGCQFFFFLVFFFCVGGGGASLVCLGRWRTPCWLFDACGRLRPRLHRRTQSFGQVTVTVGGEHTENARGRGEIRGRWSPATSDAEWQGRDHRRAARGTRQRVPRCAVSTKNGHARRAEHPPTGWPPLAPFWRSPLRAGGDGAAAACRPVTQPCQRRPRALAPAAAATVMTAGAARAAATRPSGHPPGRPVQDGEEGRGVPSTPRRRRHHQRHRP